MQAPKPLSLSLHEQIGAFIREKCKVFSAYEYAICEFLPTILDNQNVRMFENGKLLITRDQRNTWLTEQNAIEPYKIQTYLLPKMSIFNKLSKYQDFIDFASLALNAIPHMLYGKTFRLMLPRSDTYLSSQLYLGSSILSISTQNINDSEINNSEIISEPGEAPPNVKVDDKTVTNTTITTESKYENRVHSEDCAYIKIGPTFHDSHHYKVNHANNVLEAISKRTKLNQELKPDSEEYGKFVDCYDFIINNVFTDVNIRDTFNLMMAHDSSFLIKGRPKKMSEEEFYQRLYENFDKPLSHDVTFESFLKLESIHKLKAPRMIINEGPNTVVGQLLTALIYEHILFTWLPANSIKLLTRDQFSRQLSVRHSQTDRKIFDGNTNTTYETKEFYMLEIDQTSFDMSESSKLNQVKQIREGLLVGESLLFDKISSKLFDVLEVSLSNRAVTWRRNVDTKLAFHTKTGVIKAKLDRRVRHSGDRMTSSGNFLVEFVSTMVALFDDPLAVMKRIPKYKTSSYSEFWHSETTRKHIERYNGFTGKVQGTMCLVSPIIEGDDGMVGIESNGVLNEDTILQRYNNLGLDAKVALITRGAVNFCGINYLVENGRTLKDVFCPDIIRAISKVGIARKTLSKQDIYSANLVRAAEFAGKQDWLARIYKQISDAHECNNVILNKEDTMKYGNSEKSKIINTYEKYYNSQAGLDLATQAKLLIMSIKDGVKSKHKNYDRLDEVVDYLMSHSSIDWYLDHPKTKLPPIIREELEPYLYTITKICHNNDIKEMSVKPMERYHVTKICYDNWEWLSNPSIHSKTTQIPLISNAACKRCDSMTVYRNISVKDMANAKKKSDLRYICLTCGHTDRQYDHKWPF